MKDERSTFCQGCGAALPDGVLSGHCPQCLITTTLDGFDLPEPGSETEIFGTFGDYELLEEIARGGMGVVYRARQKSLNRLVAVKMLLAGEFASPDFVRRFQREAESAARLQHPNIVRIFEVGLEKGQQFFSMELIEGSDLAHLPRDRPLAPRRAATYLKAIAEAVAFAHERGILHRDLKPSNILIDPFDQPRITDFGLARPFGQADLTLTSQALGTPAYISPEQGRGQDVGPPSDLYSLGALLYQLLTGRPPFQSETIPEILRQVQELEPVPPRSLNPSVPPDLQTICLKCLEKDPERRYSSARALADELDRFLKDEPIQARPVGPLEHAWRWSRRRPVTAGLSAALLVASLAGIIGVLSQWRRATRSERVMALNLYAADMRAAANALAEGDLGQARRLLTLHSPDNGQPDLRGFEWRYLWHRSQGEQTTTFQGHDSIVVSTAISPNGRWAASGGQDGRVSIWDLQEKRAVTNFTVPGHAVWDVQFSDDGAMLFSGGFNGRLQIWNAKGWQPLTNLPGRLFSLAGDLIAVASSSPFPWGEELAGPAQVRNLKTGQLLWEAPFAVRRVALSPNGRTLAFVPAGDPAKIQLWDTRTWKQIHLLEREKQVWSLSFSPDGDRLIATGWNRNFTVFDLPAGHSHTITNAHQLTVWNARFSPDGKTIVTASSDRTMALWNANSLALQRRLVGHENECWSATFTPDGKGLVSGGKDRNVMVWNLAPRAESIRPRNSPITIPIFSPDGKWLLTRAQIDNVWHSLLYNAKERSLQSDHLGYATGFTETSNDLVWFHQSDGRLRITALTNQTPRRDIPLDLQDTEFPISSVTPDGRWFFCIDRTGKLDLWSTAGQKIASFQTLPPPIRTAALSPNGQWLALSVERHYDVHLYAIPTGNLRKLTGHRDFAAGLDFSPRSDLLATGSVDADIRLFETATGRLRATLSGHLEEATDVAFSPDGRTLASVGNHSALKLWHIPTSREVASLPMPQAAMHLTFSPDAHRLAISRHDDTLEILEAE